MPYNSLRRYLIISSQGESSHRLVRVEAFPPIVSLNEGEIVFRSRAPKSTETTSGTPDIDQALPPYLWSEHQQQQRNEVTVLLA